MKLEQLEEYGINAALRGMGTVVRFFKGKLKILLYFRGGKRR